MTHPVDRALRAWFEPVREGEAGVAGFRTVYTDPVSVNGVPTPIEVLVARARMLQGAFQDLQYEILERADSPSHSAFAFQLSGLHAGPLVTPLGELAPTGRRLTLLGMDIFTIVDDLVSGVWAVADYAGLLIQAGAAQLIDEPSSSAAASRQP